MRRFFIIVMSFALSIGVNAQELKRTEPDFFYYFPLLIIFAVAAGAVTGIVFKIILPAIKKLPVLRDFRKVDD